MAATPNPLNSILPDYQQQAGLVMVQPVVFQLHVRLPLVHCPQPKGDIFGYSISGVYLTEGLPEGQLSSFSGAVWPGRKQEIHLPLQP